MMQRDYVYFIKNEQKSPIKYFSNQKNGKRTRMFFRKLILNNHQNRSTRHEGYKHGKDGGSMVIIRLAAQPIRNENDKAQLPIF
jgi:hypothetical protein